MKYVVTVLVLFLGITASAFAGAQVQQALIGSAQIKNRSIRLVDMHPSAVRSLRGRRGPQGPRGAQGLPGPAGTPGAPGAPGAPGGFDPAKVSYVVGPTVTVPAGDVGTATATCPAGAVATGGGFYASIGVPADSEAFNNNSWTVIVNNFDNAIPVNVYAFAVCAAR